jgi:hypothetical protein
VISEIADHFILDKTDVLKNQKNNPDFLHGEHYNTKEITNHF